MNKTIKTLVIIASLTLAFFLGRETAPVDVVTETVTETETEYVTVEKYETINDLMHRVVDFNTDGTELSVMLDDGTELYAYREPNIDLYQGNRITEVRDGVAYTLNGSSYMVSSYRGVR